MRAQERFKPGVGKQRMVEDHEERYKFAANYIKGKTVLDIACGSGYGANILKKNGARKVVGVDIDAATIRLCKKQYKNIEFIASSIEKFNYKSDFDVIVSFETIEHLSQELHRKVLQRLAGLLKPDGLLIISTPNKKITSPFTRKPYNPYHKYEYKVKEFSKILSKYYREIQKYYQRNVFFIFTWVFIRKIIIILNYLFPGLINIYNGKKGRISKSVWWCSPKYLICCCRKKNE